MQVSEDVERVIESPTEHGVIIEKYAHDGMESSVCTRNYNKVMIYSSGWVEGIEPEGAPGETEFHPPSAIYRIATSDE